MGRLAGMEAVGAMGDEACVTTCYLHRLSLFLCQAATMVKPIHPFAELSPEECQKEITPGDVWPVSSISFDREKGEMVMAIRHHASATDYCEQSTAGMDRHVFHHCVPIRMAIVRGLMELAMRVMPVGKVKLSMGGERLEGTGGRGEQRTKNTQAERNTDKGHERGARKQKADSACGWWEGRGSGGCVCEWVSG